ncbi:MAG: hypothetical protein KatS3mg105_4390 [Gemmatales bacterium]|nr:MAG: hypothetical protein KatS3mg105_4390 [Gemmatales bacterium]
MKKQVADDKPPLPRWLKITASVAICFHFFSIAIRVLAAPSGPWGDGPPVLGPFFARQADRVTRDYLQLVKLPGNYHFDSNRPMVRGVVFEVTLKDARGEPVETVRIPSDDVNAYVKHRHHLLAQWLALDQFVEPPMGDLIMPKGQEVPKVLVWQPDAKNVGQLVNMDINQLPRDRPTMGPSPWSLLVARSYCRYLCRKYDAAKAELVRRARNPIGPIVLSMDNVQEQFFDETVSNFGEMSR